MKKIILTGILIASSLLSCNEGSLIEGIEPTEKPAKAEKLGNKVKINSDSYDIVWAENKAKSGQIQCPGTLQNLIMINLGKNAQGYEQFVRIDNLRSFVFKETAGVFTNSSCTMEVALIAVDANYNTVAMYISVGEGTVELKGDKTFIITNVKLSSVYSPGNYVTVSASGKYTG